MEWSDMSQGKWDVRRRLSAARHKLSLLRKCDQLPGSLLLLEPGHHLAALLVLGLHRAPLQWSVTTSIISQLVTWPIFCLTCSSSSSTRGVWWNLAASTRGVKPHLSLSRGLTPHPATRNCTQWV